MRRVIHSLVDSETVERGCCNRTGSGWVIASFGKLRADLETVLPPKETHVDLVMPLKRVTSRQSGSHDVISLRWSQTPPSRRTSSREAYSNGSIAQLGVFGDTILVFSSPSEAGWVRRNEERNSRALDPKVIPNATTSTRRIAPLVCGQE